MKTLGRSLVLLLLLASPFFGQATPEPVNAIQSALASRSDLPPDVLRFYAENDDAFAWFVNGHPSSCARSVIHVLEHAEEEGLEPNDYDASLWSERLAHLEAQPAPAEQAAFDIALTAATLKYAHDLHLGRTDAPGFHSSARELDLVAFLRELAASSDPTAKLASLEPALPEYQRIKLALARYTKFARQPDGDQLPPSIGVVKRGGYYDHLAALIKRLQQFDDLPSDLSVPPITASYGGPVIDGVRRFQSSHGLNPTGNLDQETIDALNVPLATRVDQLRLALERDRWISADLSGPHVIVNLPEYRLRAYDQGEHIALDMRVLVGDADGFQTPTLESTIDDLIFRPYWYIPPSIFRSEILPEMEADRRDYLRVNEMEVITRDGRVVTNGSLSDAVLRRFRDASNASLVTRQRPGPDNALGLLKVNFRNQQDVYIHDTPVSMHLFASGESDVSHGCIHVEDPAKLAQWLLRDQPDWTDDRIQKAMQHGRDENVVKLSGPVPLLIVYNTATVDEDGTVHFYGDVYGQDRALAQSLAHKSELAKNEKGAEISAPGEHR